MSKCVCVCEWQTEYCQETFQFHREFISFGGYSALTLLNRFINRVLYARLKSVGDAERMLKSCVDFYIRCSWSNNDFVQFIFRSFWFHVVFVFVSLSLVCIILLSAALIILWCHLLYFSNSNSARHHDDDRLNRAFQCCTSYKWVDSLVNGLKLQWITYVVSAYYYHCSLLFFLLSSFTSHVCVCT